MKIPACLCACLFVAAAHGAGPLVIPLWPAGVPGAQPAGGAEYVQDGRVYNVQVPTLTYLPAAGVSVFILKYRLKGYGHPASLRDVLCAVHLVCGNPSPALLALLLPDRHVTRETPPVFLVHTAENQSVPVENSLAFYAAARHAGVPVEMHLFEKGPHGFGVRTDLGPASDWPRLAQAWLRSLGFLPAVPR